MKNIFWEEIKSIEYIEEDDYPYEYVYDFSVKDIETFTTEDNIVVCNTLNTFHQCGISNQVTQGVPRIRELISVSKKIKTPSMRIFLKSEYEKNKTLIKELVHNIQMISFDFFIDNTTIWYDPDIRNTTILQDKSFMDDIYEFYEDIENLNQISPWVLRIEIHPLYMINKNITMFEIYHFLLQKFEKKINKLHIIYSDEISECNVFHIRHIYKNRNEILYDNIPVTNNDYKILLNMERELTCNCLFKGVNQISKAIITKINSADNEPTFVIDTIGTNLKEILQRHEYINLYKTISNDIHEVYANLGIEAAREKLKREIYDVLDQSCVEVNDAHVSLLVDTMTLNGGLISMNRYGISKSDNGIITMASFEEPDTYFTMSSVYDIADEMNGTSGNILAAQPCKFGTGMVDLIFDIEKFKKNSKETKHHLLPEIENEWFTMNI